MNRMSRSLVAGALAAVVALGVTTPVAAAAPKDGHSHVHKAKAHKVKLHKAHKGGKATVKAAKAGKARAAKAGKARIAKADRRTLHLQRHLTRHVVRKERFLERTVSSRWVTSLPADQKQAVSLNISTDLSELADLKVAISSGQELRALSREVRAVRPEVYLSTLSQLRWANRLRGEVLALGLETTQVDRAIAALRGFDARTSRRDLWNVKRALVDVRKAVEVAKDAQEETPEETPVETPVETPEEPVTEEPVSGDPVVVS